MDESAQANAVAAVLPDPPPFYQYFTPSNVQSLKSLRATKPENKGSDSRSSLPLCLPDLPDELQYLLPPEPPSEAEGKFRCFGDVYYVKEDLPSLQDMGVEQVYTPPSTPSRSQTPSHNTLAHHDRAFILKRLAKSLLLNFLELVGIMATNSSQWFDKVQDIRTLSVNFHHLLNEYRPHQARESLILIMKERLESRRAEIKAVRDCQERVAKVLEGLGAIELIDETPKDSSHVLEVEADIYQTLDKEFG